MEKLRETIEEYGRWKELSIYIDRMEAFLESDFSSSVSNAKSLLETIGKEICEKKGVELKDSPSLNLVINSAFRAMGYQKENLVAKIAGSLSTIGQEIGILRNEISVDAHGKTLNELRERNNKVDLLTREFLIDSTLIVAIFLIRNFENTTTETTEKEKLNYDDVADFNDFWDDSFGEFEMGEYSFLASEILYSLDLEAYETEYKAFMEPEPDREEEE
jgi:hypothetical protein